MKKLFRKLPGPVRNILSVIGAAVFAGYMVVAYYLAYALGSVTRWRERRTRVAAHERECEEIRQQLAQEEEFRRANPPHVDVPSDNIRVCALQFPMTFLTEAKFPAGFGAFLADHGIHPCTRVTREQERALSAALATVGGEFVTTTDDSGFDTGVEIWFRDQAAAAAFQEKWL